MGDLSREPDHHYATGVSIDDIAGAWLDTFKLVSDPTRLRLLLSMHYRGPGEATTSDLAKMAEVKLATASAALKTMEAQGVVKASKEGREVRYSLISHEVHHLLHYIGGTHQRDAMPIHNLDGETKQQSHVTQ